MADSVLDMEMIAGPIIAEIAALVGDPTRATMICRL
jgi:hypothetical protein